MAKFALRYQKGKSSEGMLMQGRGWFCLRVNRGAAVPTLCVPVEEFHPGSGAHPNPNTQNSEEWGPSTLQHVGSLLHPEYCPNPCGPSLLLLKTSISKR